MPLFPCLSCSMSFTKLSKFFLETQPAPRETGQKAREGLDYLGSNPCWGKQSQELEVGVGVGWYRDRG